MIQDTTGIESGMNERAKVAIKPRQVFGEKLSPDNAGPITAVFYHTELFILQADQLPRSIQCRENSI